MEKEILLESGTNEVEILVFRVGGYSLGVNVAKVREVLPSQKITHLPQAHDSIVGCFTLREHVVPCVSLHKHLGEPVGSEIEETTIILTEFNQYQTAFVVDSVERIHRISWNNVLAAPSIFNGVDTPVTAITELDGRLILMLDFEMIADQVSEQTHQFGEIENPHNLARDQFKILLADDSNTVRQAVVESLRSNGYTDITVFENGELAWKWIQKQLGETGSVSKFADLLISDIEMPRIDGLHLTNNIKQHPELKKMFVLLYSSINTEDNRKKGYAVNADGMISKPELSKIVGLADEMILKRQNHNLEVQAKPETAAQDAQSTQQPPSHPSPNSENGKSETPAAENSVTEPQSDNGAPNSRLWVTFRNELTERVEQLDALCSALADAEPDDATINDAFRVLHSIKSASMVVPVDPVAHLTHLMETSVDLVRQSATEWPHSDIGTYVDWLRKLVNPENDEHEVQAVLNEAGRLEKELKTN